MKKQQTKAFTLVELIIVITILAILATIGFISYQSYTLDARDGKRVSDLGQIRKGLEIYQTKNSQLPTPDAQITNIVNASSVLEYQGYAGTNVLNKIRADQVKDPKDNIQYTYSTNGDYTKFQLMSMLENGSAVNLSQTPVNTTYAATDYTSRKTYVVGNKLGVFLDNSTKAPIQETLSGNIDLAGAYSGTNFKVVFSNTSANSGAIVGSGVSLYNNVLSIANTVATTPAPVTYNWYLSGSSWIFKDSNNNITYPTTCNNLLTNSGTFYIAGSLTASGSGFKDGVYTINPTGTSTGSFDVYCDMNTDNGGWILVYKVGGNVSTENAAGMNTDKNLSNLLNLTLNTSTALSHYNFSKFNSIGNNWIIRSYSDCTNTGNDFCQKLYLKSRVGLEENIGTALSRTYNDSGSRLQVATRYSSQTYQGIVYQDVPTSDTDYGVGFYTRNGSRTGECNTSTTSIGTTTMSNCHAFFAFGGSASTGFITWAFGTPSHTWTRNGIVWLK